MNAGLEVLTARRNCDICSDGVSLQPECVECPGRNRLPEGLRRVSHIWRTLDEVTVDPPVAVQVSETAIMFAPNDGVPRSFFDTGFEQYTVLPILPTWHGGSSQLPRVGTPEKPHLFKRQGLYECVSKRRLIPDDPGLVFLTRGLGFDVRTACSEWRSQHLGDMTSAYGSGRYDHGRFGRPPTVYFNLGSKSASD